MNFYELTKGFISCFSVIVLPCFRVTRALASVSKIVRLNFFGSMFFIHISLTSFYVLVLPSKLDNEALQSALFIP